MTENTDLFYWLFLSRDSPDTDPLVIWLTGGPGCSSELAAFVENGPLYLEEGKVKQNPHAWNNKANLLYLDQPVGTGYSNANILDMARDEEAIKETFGEFLIKFYKLYPEFKNRPLYITGESYAGHYIPFMANHLVQNEEKFHSHGITLKGIAIGNGWVDPYQQYAGYSPFSYHNKLINIIGKYSLDVGFGICRILVKYNIKVVNMYVCSMLTQIVLGSPIAPRFNVYDIRKKCESPPLCYDFSEIHDYFNRDDVKRELGVPERDWEECNMAVHTALLLDFERNAAPEVTSILESGLPVLVYNGDKDYICNWEGSQLWVNELEWSGKEEFKKKEMGGVEGGSKKKFKNFTFHRIFDAGHMVPMDQPEVALKMLNEFIDSSN